MIGGNIEAVVQRISGSTTNRIGETILTWVDMCKLRGWLDLSSGESRYTYNAKLQESTHIFLTDYTPIDQNASDKRLVVNGVIYEILLIDDPMGLHEHLEIYLKFVG